MLARLTQDDVLYEGGTSAALQLPTFLGNHDAGRFAFFLREARPQMGAAEELARTLLGHAMLLTLRGVPTLYYGDEQGFAGTGNDQQARQDMFPSRVAEYNSDRLVGTSATTATDNFATDHPVYAEVARLAKLRRATPALLRGATTVRASSDKPGLFAVSRFDPDNGREVLIAFNTSDTALTAQVAIDPASRNFAPLSGDCPAMAAAPGSLTLTLLAFGYAVCAAQP